MLVITNATSPEDHLLSWNVIDADADRATVEILCKIKTASVTAGIVHCGVAFRGAGTTSALEGYMVAIYGDDLRLYKGGGGSAPTSIASVALTLTTTVWYWLLVRASGDSLKAKISSSGIPDGSSWDIDVTDSSHTAAGWVGAYSNSTAADPSYDFFGVGTAGDAAPAERQNPSKLLCLGVGGGN
jgi:hypothetical protein